MNRRIGPPATKLAVFALVSLGLTALLAATVSPLSLTGTHTFRAEFTDVTGLLPGDDVRIAGVRIGAIEHLAVIRRSLAEVTFTVDSGVRIADGVRAAIRYRNLTGQRYLTLTDGAGNGDPLPEDGLIPLAHTQPALDLTVLLNGFRPLFQALNPADVNTLATQIVKVLQGEPGTITSLLTHTASITQALAGRDEAVGAVITNLNGLLGAVQSRDGQLTGMIGQLQRLVSALAADKDAIGDSLTNLSDLTGATAGLLDEGRPAIQADLAGLAQVTGTLAGSQGLVEGVLTRLPGKLGALTSAATTGSWADLYLCELGGTATLPEAGRVPLRGVARQC